LAAAIDTLGYLVDALLFGRVTYEMMEAAFRPAAGWERGLGKAVQQLKRESGKGLLVVAVETGTRAQRSNTSSAGDFSRGRDTGRR
jgi:hypothetical protein